MPLKFSKANLAEEQYLRLDRIFITIRGALVPVRTVGWITRRIVWFMVMRNRCTCSFVSLCKSHNSWQNCWVCCSSWYKNVYNIKLFWDGMGQNLVYICIFGGKIIHELTILGYRLDARVLIHSHIIYT